MFENIEWRLIARDEASAVTEKVAEAEKKLAKVTQDASEAGQRSSSSWKETAKGFFAGQVAIQAMEQAFSFLKNQVSASINEAIEFQRVDAQLSAALTSTGYAVGFTKKELSDYADQLSSVTAIDDDVIKSAEAMLVTFTNVRNEGFKEATKAVLDMATAMNGGGIPSMEQLKATAIQVGKALNDPEKGATALTRAGVTLTDAQQKLIEKFEKTGQLAKAQKIVLDELSKEFGGSAALAAQTYEGKIAKLNNAFGDIRKNIGLAIVAAVSPYIDSTTEMAKRTAQASEKTSALAEIVYTAAEFIKGAGYIIQAVGKILGTWIVTIITAGNVVVNFSKDVLSAFKKVGDAGKVIFESLSKAATGEFSYAWETLKKGMNFDFTNTQNSVSLMKNAISMDMGSIGDSFNKAGEAFKNGFDGKNLDNTTKAMAEASEKLAQKQRDAKDSLEQWSGDHTKAGNKIEEALKKVVEDYQDSTTKITEQLAKLDQEHSDKIKSITEKITTLKNQLKILNDEFTNSTGDANKSEAEKVIEQEQKVADLKKKIAEEQKNLAKNTDGNSDTSRLTDLQSELSKEEQALRLYSEKRKGLDAELAEARRRANLTEFERFVEDVNAKRIEAQKEYDEKVGRLKQEIVEQEASRAAEQLVYEAKRAQYLETQESFKKFHDNYLSSLDSMNKATKSTVDQMNQKLQQLNAIVSQIESAKNKAGLSGAIISDVQATENKAVQAGSNSNTININLGGVTVTNKADADNLVQSIIRQLQLQGLASA